MRKFMCFVAAVAMAWSVSAARAADEQKESPSDDTAAAESAPEATDMGSASGASESTPNEQPTNDKAADEDE